MREVVELAARIAELERRFAGQMQHGTVEEVDPKKGLVRLKFGEDKDGNPFLGPWVPYGQTAGAMKFHNPPSVGQQMTQMAPTGDWMQAVALPMHWSDQNASPSDKGDEHVMTFGSVTVTIKGGALNVKVGGVTVDISDAGVFIEGGRVDHDEKNIGKDHKHEDVEPGGGLTGFPIP